MTELVRHREGQQLVERHPPLLEQPPAPVRTRFEQRFLQERLPFLEDGERRAVWIPIDSSKDRLPVVGLDEKPRPLAEPGQIHVSEHLPELPQLGLAVPFRVAGMAIEAKACRDGGGGLSDSDAGEAGQENDTEVIAHAAPPRVRGVPRCGPEMATSMTGG